MRAGAQCGEELADDGTEETLTNWNVPEHDARASTMMGASTLHSDQIDKYELRTADGLRLVTLDAP